MTEGQQYINSFDFWSNDIDRKMFRVGGLVFFLVVSICFVSGLEDYKENEVLEFISSVQGGRVSEKCFSSLTKVFQDHVLEGFRSIFFLMTHQ